MFSVAKDGFELDGTPFRVLSGSLHYFRVHPDHWADRMVKARALGLNTIDTYIAWNFHSRTPGEFRTDGWRDLGAFLDLAAEYGLKAIVRPGPYICAEWRNAGFPTWLTAQGPELRTADPAYLAAVEEYFAAALPIVAERQVTRGGNVLMVQVENEYGAYGEDKDYLRALVAMTRAQGIEVPLFTCDQANDEMLSRGGLPEILTTATFGSRSTSRLEVLRRHQSDGPLMCTEFWDGWFDSWGQHHHTTGSADSAQDLDDLLAAGASANLYMLHGGTNFGLMNGANHKGTYVPIVTSYDYDAPLSEDGATTEKYEAFRAVIGKYVPQPSAPSGERQPAPILTVPLRFAGSSAGPWAGSWLDAAGAPEQYTALPPMDQVDPEAFFALYRTHVTADDAVLNFAEVRDRAWFFLDGEPIGTLQRHLGERTLALPARDGELTILVEDLGRVNYASHLGETKGLIGPARTAVREVTEWSAGVVDLARLAQVGAVSTGPSADGPVAGPVVLTGTFDVEAGRDLFLDTSAWGTGLVWINGFLLGRYWAAGPTRTMYIPGPLVQSAGNTLVVWELSGMANSSARFVAQPDLGHTEA